MDLFINEIHQVSSLYRNFGNKKTLVTFSLVRNHSFVKINLLELGYIKEMSTICMNSLQTISDKSS